MMTGAGQLNRRVTFQQRVPGTDKFGNPTPGDWQDVYTCAARLQPRFGGSLTVEGIAQARLSSQQPYNLVVRNSAAARAVRPDWQVIDARDTPRVFAIKTIVDPDECGHWLEMLVVENGAS
jgi:head-tail adaptor